MLRVDSNGGEKEREMRREQQADDAGGVSIYLCSRRGMIHKKVLQGPSVPAQIFVFVYQRRSGKM